MSISELFIAGFIQESDFDSNGRVDEDVRLIAEARFESRDTGDLDELSNTTLNGIVNTVTRHEPDPTEHTPPTTGERNCCVCMARQRTHAVAPCFHRCMCATCVLRVSRCPMCRSIVCGRHRIWD